MWRRKAIESESGLSKVRWEEFARKSIWRMRNVYFPCTYHLSFQWCLTDPKAINNSSDLFTLIATETTEERSFCDLRFMACSKWSFSGAMPTPCSANCKCFSWVAPPLSWSVLKGQCSLHRGRAAKAALIPERVSDSYCTVTCLVSKKLRSNIIRRLLTMKSIQCTRSPSSSCRRELCAMKSPLWESRSCPRIISEQFDRNRNQKIETKGPAALIHLFIFYCIWKWGWHLVVWHCVFQWKSRIYKHDLSSPDTSSSGLFFLLIFPNKITPVAILQNWTNPTPSLSQNL